jgi:prophage regulatory protein
MAGRNSGKTRIFARLFFCPGESSTEFRHMAKRLIGCDDLALKGIHYSKPHLWRLEKQNKFPKRVPIGAARYGYVEAEIDAYVDELIAARDAGRTVAEA